MSLIMQLASQLLSRRPDRTEAFLLAGSNLSFHTAVLMTFIIRTSLCSHQKFPKYWNENILILKNKNKRLCIYIYVLKNMLTSIISLRDLFSINVNFLQIILVPYPFGDNVISAHIFYWETNCHLVKF